MAERQLLASSQSGNRETRRDQEQHHTLQRQFSGNCFSTQVVSPNVIVNYESTNGFINGLDKNLLIQSSFSDWIHKWRPGLTYEPFARQTFHIKTTAFIQFKKLMLATRRRGLLLCLYKLSFSSVLQNRALYPINLPTC